MALPSILQDAPGLGEQFGTGLGQGIGGTLQQLANLKLNQFAQRQQAAQTSKAFQQLPGITPEIAQFLGALSPEERRYPLQNLGALMQLGQMLSPQAALHVQPQQPSGMEALQGLNASHLLSNPNQVNPLIQQALSKVPLQPNQPLAKSQSIGGQNKQQPGNNDAAQLISDIFTSPQEKLTALKETKKYVDTLKDQEKAAKESDLRLNRMVKLIEKGKLPNAGLWSFLTKIEEAGPLASGAAGALLGHVVPGIGHVVGGVAGALSSPLAGAAKSIIRSGSPDVEEFEKLSADFVKNAKQFFGSRITDADLRVFMQTLPTLMQTDAGKKKVIENLKSLNELSEIESKAAREIIRDNGGIPPLDIEQQVKDRISDEVDKVAKRFIG